MKKRALITTALIMSTFSLLAADGVELTGTYLVQVGCHKTYHEEISFVVEPGKDKFSGTRHAVSLTSEQKKQLRSGMTIKIKGKKHPLVQKTMTKGEVRKAMYKHLKDYTGMPLHGKDMDQVISKIAETPAAQAGAHDHGKLELKAVDDDTENVDVSIMGHVVVETIEILK
ncbi:hypothetical protein BVX99_00080 [bacterium F16]|nr:hypothetical protein BVX99_00080 [bacterium F16]